MSSSEANLATAWANEAGNVNFAFAKFITLSYLRNMLLSAPTYLSVCLSVCMPALKCNSGES